MSAENDPSIAERIRQAVAESTQADYDGHTEFARMTPAQRLAWLDQAVLFIHRVKGPPLSASAAVHPPAGSPKNTSV